MMLSMSTPSNPACYYHQYTYKYMTVDILFIAAFDLQTVKLARYIPLVLFAVSGFCHNRNFFHQNHHFCKLPDRITYPCTDLVRQSLSPRGNRRKSSESCENPRLPVRATPHALLQGQAVSVSPEHSPCDNWQVRCP